LLHNPSGLVSSSQWMAQRLKRKTKNQIK